ncbi:hypothetical protein A9Q83_00810 [Alphaproteobacteria bacterium 46_93_T64]|nr:hypothetical protein A9Q83_00810 [Alphaproteobacteria bacterium 46_93_T64]
MHLQSNTKIYIVFLAAAVAIGPLATDMYLPSLPLLAKVFAVSVSEVQWTLSVFMIGIAVFQLIIGPISDRFGRKPVLISGLLIFGASCFASETSSTIVDLTFYRFLQSLGVCIAVVIPRAMVRDLFDRDEAASKLSKMGTLMGFAPALAPILGGYIVLSNGWGGVFFFLGIYAFAVAIIVIFFVEETLLRKDKAALRPKYIFANYQEILSSSEFLGYAVTAGLCFGGFFAYISSSSFVLINVIGIPVEQFGYYFGFVVIGFILGTLLGPWLSRKISLHKALQVGALFSCVGGLFLLIFAQLHNLHPLEIILPMFIYNIGVGIVIPQCQAGAMHPFPEKAGSASALAGFIILGFSASLGLTVAELYDGTHLPMVVIIFAMGVLTLVFNHLAVYRPIKEKINVPN